MKIRKTCLVTGGAGFIGSNICLALLNKDYIVYCIDNLLTGKSQNLAEFKNNPDFNFINANIIEFSDSVFNKIKIDYIFHLASPASPPQYRKYSIETLLVNSIGTYKILDIAKKHKSRFLLSSTSEVYGDPKEHSQKESYFGNVNPVGLRACYDESKRFAEALTMEFYRKHKVDVRIIRIFNTYGPNMQVDDGRAISNFINQAIKGKPITIYGDGDQTRSFCYVSDMVDGLIEAMEKDGISGEIINLGNPTELTIINVAKLILKLSGSKSAIVRSDERLENDPEKRKPDISKAENILKFAPVVDLKTGLEKTIAYFKSL